MGLYGYIDLVPRSSHQNSWNSWIFIRFCWAQGLSPALFVLLLWWRGVTLVGRFVFPLIYDFILERTLHQQFLLEMRVVRNAKWFM